MTALQSQSGRTVPTTPPTPRIQAIIFDLDNCLVAGDAIGRARYQPAHEAIGRANHAAGAAALGEAELAAAFDAMWRHPLEDVARDHRFTPAMLAGARAVFQKMEVRAPFEPYADFGVLAKLARPRFLVTTGFQRLQESKVELLGLRELFTGIYIDVVDEPGRKGKQQLFRDIQQAHGFEPRRMLVVGDSAESEIRAGNNLGMTTVQILRPGVPYGANAAHHVRGLRELQDLLG